MRRTTLFFGLTMVLILGVGACASDPTTRTLPERSSDPTTRTVRERSVDLGFGFQRVTLAEPTVSSFESIGHFGYLYYRDQRICSLGDCSVSPTGTYAIYQEGASGNLFLFRRADGKTTQLTPAFVALVEKFVWQEKAGTVEAHFGAEHGVKKFPLQSPQTATRSNPE